MNQNPILQQLQNLDIDTRFLITGGMSGENIAQPIVLANILFKKTTRNLGFTTNEKLPFEINTRKEAVDFYAHKEVFTQLGVLLFELLFSAQSYIECTITNEQSDLKQLFFYIDKESRNSHHCGLKLAQQERYKSFEYFSQAVTKFPLSEFRQNPRTVFKNELPTLYFGCSNHHNSYSKEHLEKADQLIITLTVSSLIQLAELFLDVGRATNQQTEICLENPLYGFGGVSDTSIEARFWLPNSFGFYTEKIEDLKF